MKEMKKVKDHSGARQLDLKLMYLDNAQMKQMFKISDTTLWRWRKQKLMKYAQVGRKFYYPYHLVLNFMKARAEGVQ